MRTSLLRRLLRRGEPEMKPLAMRTTWGDFAHRMHRAIEIDIQVELGEVTLAELKAMQLTRPVPIIDHGAPTEAAPSLPRYWFYSDETVAMDPKRTQTMETAIFEA